MEKIVDATLARRQLGTLLDEVYHKGESVIIERKGKPLAKIVPLNAGEDREREAMTKTQKRLLDKLNSLPTFEIEEDPTDLLKKIRKKRTIEAKGQYGK